MILVRMLIGILIMAMLLFMGTADAVATQAPPGTQQSIRGGGVAVDVMFLKEGGDDATFQVAFDTHSVNLDVYSFEKIVRLRDGRGGELIPTAVEDVQGSGHHRKATVRFAWPEPKPKVLELVVKDVAGVPERVFQWTLQ
jgi:hypothetical protein